MPVLTASQRVTTALFEGLFGRDPGPAALAFWSARLEAGADPAAVARALVASPEFARHVVAGAYVALLGRAPDAAGSQWWTARVGAGVSIDRLRAALLGSDEAWRAAGSDPAAYVDALYRALLGRAPDPGGQAYLLDRLRNGTPRRTLVAWLLRSPEVDRRLADHWYQVLLGRAPTADERAQWVARLRGGASEQKLIAELAASAQGLAPA